MTTNVREVAELALADIRDQPRRHVLASRKGVVAAVRHVLPRNAVVFRRGGNVMPGVHMETWRNYGGGPPTYHELPPDMQHQAGEMLDSL